MFAIFVDMQTLWKISEMTVSGQHTVGLHYDIYQKIKSVNVELCDPYNKVNTLESQHTRNNSPHMFVSRVLVS